jgi:hypothetical protein
MHALNDSAREMKMIEVVSNGSKWGGEPPDTVEQLLARLEAHTLDPIFELFGNFVFEPRKAKHLGNDEYQDLGPAYPGQEKVTRFWGNFYDVSEVFCIDTNEPELIAKLTKAIRSNQRTPAYKAAKAAPYFQAAKKRVPARRELKREAVAT